MMANAFMYAALILNYNKVMCIILESYKVASFVEH
jgi:hypothetical protein